MILLQLLGINENGLCSCQGSPLLFLLSQIIRNAIDITIKLGIYLITGIIEYSKHWFIIGQYPCIEALDAALFGDFGNIIQEESPHTLLLPFILDKKDDIELLEELSEFIQEASLCALGQTAPNPVLSTIKHFRDEYEAHIKENRCPAGVCKELINYYINADDCIGCGLCAKNCPTNAISATSTQKSKRLRPTTKPQGNITASSLI